MLVFVYLNRESGNSKGYWIDPTKFFILLLHPLPFTLLLEHPNVKKKVEKTNPVNQRNIKIPKPQNRLRSHQNKRPRKVSLQNLYYSLPLLVPTPIPLIARLPPHILGFSFQNYRGVRFGYRSSHDP